MTNDVKIILLMALVCAFILGWMLGSSVKKTRERANHSQPEKHQSDTNTVSESDEKELCQIDKNMLNIGELYESCRSRARRYKHLGMNEENDQKDNEFYLGVATGYAKVCALISLKLDEANDLE
jgi:hypothetical protein